MSMFKKNKLSNAIVSVIASSAIAAPAFAQDEAIEEVFVTGIRASLEASMDVKRNSAGVVDAISAEDIGKFPDTNLAESLQRITGVSISRTNGEGSEVTVRGFGAEYNLITLNGRHMPAASVYGGGSGAGGTNGSSNRSFDFSNIASESVSKVEVYKTSKASIATGGMGATINIGTARPLDSPGMKGSVGVKAVHDTTNRTGSDITPELSGIFSFTNDAETFGVAVSGSYQQRHSGNRGVAENEWNISRWDATDGGNNGNNLFSFTDDAEIVNAPADGQLFGRPNDLRYSFSDQERDRLNGQLVVQFAPTEKFTGTVDYTFAENKIKERRGESTSWLANGNSIDRVVFDDGAVATPIYIHETAGPRDQGYEQQLRKQKNTLNSAGLNLEFQATDNFSVTLDAHNSTMKSLPDGPGKAGEIATSIAAPTQVAHWIEFNDDMPLYDWEMDDSSRGDGDGVFSFGDIGSQVVRVFYNAQETEITQVQLDGAFDFDSGRLDFGVESRAMETTQQSSNRYMAMGDWGVANPGDIPASMMEMFNLSKFDDYNASRSSQVGIRGDAEVIGQHLVDLYGTADNGYVLAYEPNFANDDKVKEDTKAAFFQITMEGEFAGRPVNLVTGLRYETTNVESTSLVQIPIGLLWQDNNDFQVDYGDNPDFQPFSADASYDNLLPSLDFDIEVIDDLKARFSYSKTIARAQYGNLKSSVGNFGSGGGSTYNGATRVATSSNPALLPLESDNVDISLEWYYSDSSYASVGFFEKRVSNFIGREKVTEQHFDMRDQTTGARAEAAVAELASQGIALDDTSLFVMEAIMTQTSAANVWTPADYATAAADPATKNQFEIDVATALDIRVTGEDPISNWLTDKPVNNREAKLYGAEFAVQHFFGESGFGLQANYTVVEGDVSYDNLADPGEAQFALLGLSDTANLVAVYDNYGVQARIAYNWRDEYLRSASEDTARNPIYVEEHGQIDLNVSYDINDMFSVFFEGLNVTGENYREHQRTTAMIQYLEELGPRYQVGARFNF
ncbi:TonB-dependent receptor [Alteromonadaceae bacterium 2753L.S.0a.02]|nr:TonB-dependent receptor [Alteromonadaceae bacterium 2753L.S.0a.02]